MKITTTTTIYKTPNFHVIEKPGYQPSIEKDLLDAMKLHWWRIYGYQDDKGTLDKHYEAKGWHGITLTGLSSYEDAVIRSWITSQNPKSFYMSKKDWTGGEYWAEHYIGEYKDYDYNIWLESSKQMRDFIIILKRFPERNKITLIELDDEVGLNYKYLNGKILTGSNKKSFAWSD
jgi:hypothetical protein